MDARAPKPPRPGQSFWRRYGWLIVAAALAAIALHGIFTHPPKPQAPTHDSGAPPVPGAQ